MDVAVGFVSGAGKLGVNRQLRYGGVARRHGLRMTIAEPGSGRSNVKRVVQALEAVKRVDLKSTQETAARMFSRAVRLFKATMIASMLIDCACLVAAVIVHAASGGRLNTWTAVPKVMGICAVIVNALRFVRYPILAFFGARTCMVEDGTSSDETSSDVCAMTENDM